jgi:hypothetical protein
MRYEDMQVLVDQAAELLPEPPLPGNRDGYAGWTALTIDTGCQLARILGADTALLRSLLDEDQWTPAACRQRRRLLLSVALYTARQRAGALAAPPRQVVMGDIVAAAGGNSPLPVLRLG